MNRGLGGISFAPYVVRVEMGAKQILIVAGPNGAGKTTFAREYLPGEAATRNFVNADLIAAGLAPFGPEQVAVKAGRIMIEMLREYERHGRSFAFETTLAGRNYARSIRRWRANGYRVELLFLSLRCVDMAIVRVAERVRHGGHAIAEDVIRRRYKAGWVNYSDLYRPLVDVWHLYDNSDDLPVLLESGENP